MKHFSNELLSILCLLLVLGFFIIAMYNSLPMIFLGYLMVFIGGLSFGTLLGRSKR